ncbi:UBP-type zinc finger domain-containing protein [Nocardioides sp. YIM 152588]|uniref:UBP-type zinc finger domain-containing protein n=1 Tax=Nocardioides sp. YIM 152588 TaxID=3158259 RepID=UPI0032E3D7FE
MSASDEIDPTAVPSGPGCLECESAGGWWLHLRRCAGCGHIGCCDSSPSQHASGHWRATGHRYVRSSEPGEAWFWDYRDQDFADGPPLADPQHRPLSQAVPGPADRVPSDWRQHLH